MPTAPGPGVDRGDAPRLRPGRLLRPGRMARLALMALVPAAMLAAAALELSGCNKQDASGDPRIAKGRVLYGTHCSSCHNMNPALDGTLGPAVKGSGLDLLKARVIHGTYPPGYTPKRDTRIMVKLPLTEADVEAVHAFLAASP